MGDNSFHTTVESLFKGMDSFITTKTVVGDAIHIGDTIILPLVDVSFGVAAGAFSQEKKNHAECCASHSEWYNKACQYQESGWSYKSAGYGAGFCEQIHIKR